MFLTLDLSKGCLTSTLPSIGFLVQRVFYFEDMTLCLRSFSLILFCILILDFIRKTLFPTNRHNYSKGNIHCSSPTKKARIMAHLSLASNSYTGLLWRQWRWTLLSFSLFKWWLWMHKPRCTLMGCILSLSLWREELDRVTPFTLLHLFYCLNHWLDYWRTWGGEGSWWACGSHKTRRCCTNSLQMTLAFSWKIHSGNLSRPWGQLGCLSKLLVQVLTWLNQWLSQWHTQFHINGLFALGARFYRLMRRLSTLGAWLVTKYNRPRRWISWLTRSGRSSLTGSIGACLLLGEPFC